MIKLEEALNLIEEVSVFELKTERISIGNIFQRVLAEDVVADVDIPAFDKSAMDGYACRREDLGLTMNVLEMIPAGKEPQKIIEKGQCSQIMTGGMLPKGADCVVMQEYVEEVSESKIIFTGSNTANNILFKAEDLEAGEILLKEGTLITAQNIAILATAGLSEALVYQRKKVGVICTGSELVEVNENLSGAKIRNTNIHQLKAQITSSGHQPVYYGIVQDDGSIKETLLKAFEQCDIMILTGGASVGKFDLVPQVLNDIGFKLKFGKVAIQPGKPVSFSVKDNKYCFGLSGNPVSSFLQFELLVRPFLLHFFGNMKKTTRLELKFDEVFTRKKAERRFFLPVIVKDNGHVVNPDYHGSAHLHAMNGIFGFAEIPEGQYELNKGDKVYVRPL